MDNCQSVEEIVWGDIGGFSRGFRSKQKPVKLSGVAKRWGSCHQWTPDYLTEKIGERQVWLAKSKSGVFDYNDNTDVDPVQLEQMLFSQAQKLICGDQSAHYYVQQQSLYNELRVLMNDVELPRQLSFGKKNLALNLWFGSTGCFSPLHRDKDENFLVQILGRKEISLFAPNQSQFLYPNIGQKLPHVSKVNLLNIEHEKYPLVAKAERFTVLLEPGDVLYIPRFWWHAVSSLDVSISLNWWWDIYARALISPVARLWNRVSQS